MHRRYPDTLGGRTRRRRGDGRLGHRLVAPSIPANGYWLVGGDGGVFAFGATFEGSCPDVGECSGPTVAVIPTRAARGTRS